MEPIEFVNGSLSAILVIGSFLIGLRIIMKYKEHKRKVFIYFGLTWIFLVEPWWPSMISFFLSLGTGQGLTLEVYLFLSFFLIPLGILSGMTAFTELMFKQKQKQILALFIIIGALVEVFFIFFLFNDPSFLGELYGVVDVNYAPLIKVFLIANLPVIIIAGSIFASESLKSDDAAVKLQGKLLVAAFTISAVGGALEVLLNIHVITMMARIIGITGGLCFHWGFNIPEWMKKRI